MAQVIATCENPGLSVLKSLMSRMKQHILTCCAKEIGLESEYEFDKFYDHVVVTCNEQKAIELVNLLGKNGCTDLHFYSEDPISRDMVESGMYGQFRVCKGIWEI